MFMTSVSTNTVRAKSCTVSTIGPRPRIWCSAGAGQACARNAVAAAPLRRGRKVEEGEVGAGIGAPVGIEQMVGAHIVLVDGLLDQPHAEQAGIKGQILARLGGNRGQMVNARQLHGLVLARHYVTVEKQARPVWGAVQMM